MLSEVWNKCKDGDILTLIVCQFFTSLEWLGSMWMLTAVKAGHLWDARLTLLTRIHQHAPTDSTTERRLSHDTSQNKERRSHTVKAPPRRTMLHLWPRSSALFSWNGKAVESSLHSLMSLAKPTFCQKFLWWDCSGLLIWVKNVMELQAVTARMMLRANYLHSRGLFKELGRLKQFS